MNVDASPKKRLFAQKRLWLYILIPLAISAIFFISWKVINMNKTYLYNVETSSPSGYEGLFESNNSYLMDKNGKVITGFGGSRDNGGWGIDGVQSSSLRDYPLPASFKVRWYSITERQYWEGTFKLPVERIQTLFEQEWSEPDPFLKDYSKDSKGSPALYYQLLIYVTPGGGVFVWAQGARLEYIGFYQAHKIPPMDWKDMEDFTLGFPVSIERLEKANLDYAKEVLPKEEVEMIRASKPYGVEHWKRRQQYYNWRLVADAPFTIRDYLTWYASGEYWFTYADESGKYHYEGVPTRIMFAIEDKKGKKEKININLNEEEMMAYFKELAVGGKKITFHVKILKDDLSLMQFSLSNGETVKEFDGKSAEIWDLYD